jgi:AcrR family transcriptional regulator
VSLQARQAVLDAAAQLLDEQGWSGFTVDEVARRSAVSKATIYKHWSGGLEVAADAYGQVVTDSVPTPATGDVVADLRSQITRLANFYATPRGAVVVQLLAAATGDQRGGDVVRHRFFAPRREASRALIEQGIANGQLRPDLDPDLTVDVLFGAMIFRLFNGEKPLKGAAARKVATTVLRAVVADPSTA